VFRGAVDYVGLAMRAGIDHATVAVEREYVACAALGADRQPPGVCRKADVPDFGGGVAAVQ